MELSKSTIKQLIVTVEKSSESPVSNSTKTLRRRCTRISK